MLNEVDEEDAASWPIDSALVVERLVVIHLVRGDLVVPMTARGGCPDGKLVRWPWLERAL